MLNRKKSAKELREERLAALKTAAFSKLAMAALLRGTLRRRMGIADSRPVKVSNFNIEWADSLPGDKSDWTFGPPPKLESP